MQLAEFVTKDIHRDDIKAEYFISAFEGTGDIARIPVFLQFSGKQFLGKKRKQAQLEIYGYAVDSNGKFRDFFYNPLNIDINKVKNKLKTHGIKYFDLLLVPPGDYRIKCIIIDSETGETGVISQELSVPRYEDQKLIVSSPIFIDKDSEWLSIPGYDPLKPTGRKKGEGLPVGYPFLIGKEIFFPGVLPTYFAHTQGEFLLRIHNLKLHPTAKVPQTDMKFEVVNDNGVSYQAVQILSIKPFQTNPNLYELLFEYEIKDMPPGHYRLKVTFTDSLAQQTISTSSPFIYK